MEDQPAPPMRRMDVRDGVAVFGAIMLFAGVYLLAGLGWSLVAMGALLIGLAIWSTRR